MKKASVERACVTVDVRDELGSTCESCGRSVRVRLHCAIGVSSTARAAICIVCARDAIRVLGAALDLVSDEPAPRPHRRWCDVVIGGARVCNCGLNCGL